jgi:hypothetical protein
LKIVQIERAGDRASAYYLGNLLVTESADVFHDACRALRKMGLAGTVQFMDKATGRVSRRLDIGKDANLSEYSDSKPHRRWSWRRGITAHRETDK